MEIDNEYHRTSTVASSQKNFNAQVAVNDNLYEIAIRYSNGTKPHETAKKTKTQSKNSQNPNSTENANAAQRARNLAVTPSTSTRSQKLSSAKSKSDANKANLNWPIEQLAEPSTIAAQVKGVAQNNRKPVKLPHGVVPFQSNLDAIQLYDDTNKANSVENNRYSNIINEAVEDNNNNEVKHDADVSNELQNVNGDSDTGAREENDSNGFVMDEHNNHMQKPLRHPNNDALNGKVDEFSLKLHENNAENSIHIANDEDLQIALKGDNLKNEVNEDQGKAYPDEANLQADEVDEDGKYFNDTLRLTAHKRTHFDFIHFISFFFKNRWWVHRPISSEARKTGTWSCLNIRCVNVFFPPLLDKFVHYIWFKCHWTFLCDKSQTFVQVRKIKNLKTKNLNMVFYVF